MLSATPRTPRAVLTRGGWYQEKGLSLVILAEWYNPEVMKKIKFFDDNTQMWWTPQTGGGHAPG